MSDVPPQGPGDEAPSTPGPQPGLVDTDNFPLQSTQKMATTSLASTMNDRHNHDALEQHGIESRADDEVGYNSLPWELRDQIRQDVIADICTLVNSPLLSAYACVDSEWQDAIEKITFRRLNLSEATGLFSQDLDLFERYIVGNRRQYLQHVRLPVYIARDRVAAGRFGGKHEPSEQDFFHFLMSPVRQLFNCLNQWHGYAPGGGSLSVEIHFTGPKLEQLGWLPYLRPLSPASLERVFQGLNNLPKIPQITQFCISSCDIMSVRSVQALLSLMPNLRSAAVCMDMPRLNRLEGMENDQEYGRQIRSFFHSLCRNIKLESLEIQYDGAPTTNLQTMLFNAALSFSQRLHKFSFKDNTKSQAISIISEICAGNFNSQAPPRLVWPNLTALRIAHLNFGSMTINQAMMVFGRAIRYMPAIQDLKVRLDYHGSPGYMPSERWERSFALELRRSVSGCSPQAKLSITLPFHQEDVPSEEVRVFWKASLQSVVNDLLDFQVEYKFPPLIIV